MAGRTAKKHLAILSEGTGKGPEPELAPLQTAALALVRGLSEEAIAAASIDELAAASLFVQRADAKQSLTHAVVVSRGVPDAVSVAASALRYSLAAADGGWMTAVWLTTGPRHRRWRLDDGLRLRHAVCAADDEVYAEARERARTLRADLELLERAYLAHAFPDEPWADEDLEALLAQNSTHFDRYAFLLSAARNAELVAELCKRFRRGLGTFALDIACGLDPADATALMSAALPPMLKKPKYGPLMKTPPRTVATALSVLQTREVAEVLAPYLGNAILGPIAAAYFQDNPELSDVLDTHATGRGARAVAERLLSQRGAADDDSPVAESAEVPAVLRDRPWRPRKKKPKPRVVSNVELPSDIEERMELPEIPPPPAWLDDARAMDEEALRVWRQRVDEGKWATADYDHVYATRSTPGYYQRIPPDEGLRAWNTGRVYLHEGRLRWAAVHGLDALAGFVGRVNLADLDYEGAEETMDALEAYVTPRMAPLMARVAAGRKKWRSRALSWFLHHRDDVTVGLVPVAVGSAGPQRRDAEEVLLVLARSGAGETVRAAAARCGEEAASVIEELLARDPLAIDEKPPKRPSFLRTADLPAVRLKDGSRLPDDACDALIEMLSVAPAGYAGVELVADACDGDSLAAFSSALLEQWVLGDAPGRHDWMLHAVVRFPSEVNTRRVAALARDWARKKKVKARRACEALGALGSDVALLHLGHIAETSRFADLRAAVRTLLDDAARTRGLTRDELEDRTVPDLGLDSSGSLVLSYGARSFTATLDESLAVVLRDAEGNRLTSVPRTRKDDDADAAEASRLRLKQLKKDVGAIADRQIRRMERAMVDGRWFSREDFVLRIAQHPVMMHLAQGLVWEARSDDEPSRTFRVDEDGSFADAGDDAMTLDDVATVRVAHPARTALGPWVQLFADYERIQPFEQLSREVYEPTAAELASSACKRAAGITLAPQKLLGLLEARGYRRNDRGFPRAYLKTLPGDIEVEISFSPGIEIAYLKTSGDQTLGEASFARRGEPIPVAEVDAVAFAELVRDLEALR